MTNTTLAQEIQPALEQHAATILLFGNGQYTTLKRTGNGWALEANYGSGAIVTPFGNLDAALEKAAAQGMVRMEGYLL